MRVGFVNLPLCRARRRRAESRWERRSPKPNDMDLRKIRRDLIQVVELVEGWTTQSEISGLERDLALDKIRAAYEAIRFDGVRREPTPQPNVSSEPEVPAVAVAPVVPSVPTTPEPGDEEPGDEEPEVEIELIMAAGIKNIKLMIRACG